MVSLRLRTRPSLVVYANEYHGIINGLRSLDPPHFVRQRECSLNFKSPLIPRSRQFYSMTNITKSRGKNTILTQKQLLEMQQSPRDHQPELRRHICALRCLEYFLLDFVPVPGMKEQTVPLRMQVLCRHYNTVVLIRGDDFQLKAVLLWGILFRRGAHIIIKVREWSNQYMYIQDRHAQHDETSGVPTICRKAQDKLPLSHDYATIRRTTILHNPPDETMFYLAMYLHLRCHGSLGSHEVTNHCILLDVIGIQNDEISPESAGRSGLQSLNNIHVAYGNSTVVRQLHNGPTMFRGVHSFKHDLVEHMLSIKASDPSREGQIIYPDTGSKTTRCRFGFGQKQKPSEIRVNWNVICWTIGNEFMPSIAYSPFTSMKESLRRPLVGVFEAATKFVKSHCRNAFPDVNRKKMFTNKLNDQLGIPESSTQFEYYDIVLTRNCVLPKHIDEKNDHRAGYDFCVVYSFHHSINGLEYKISIIMTTRTNVGAALDGLRTKHSNIESMLLP